MLNWIAGERRRVAARNDGNIDMSDLGGEPSDLCAAYEIVRAEQGDKAVEVIKEEPTDEASIDGIDTSGHEYDHEGWQPGV